MLTATERATEDQDLMPWYLDWSWVQSYMQQQNTLCIVEHDIKYYGDDLNLSYCTPKSAHPTTALN